MRVDEENEVVLITGASRGIGLGIAKKYASEGATLILTEINERYNDLKSVASEIRNQFNIPVKSLSLDIRNLKEISEMIEILDKEGFKITTLVNNAGINIIKEAIELSEEDWDEVSNINLKGTFFVTREVAKKMIASDIKGSIINIASQHGTVGNINRAVYCATKAGLINLSKALAYEWSKYGIRVNAVSPTYVETDNNSDYLKSSYGKRTYLSKIPLKKYAKPQDIANVCSFLSKNGSELITGQNIIVDGGYTIV